jgi:phosphoglycolate phosphatase
MRLVLFDIDGTILTARGAGRRALAAALKEVYGTAGDIERYDLRGRTDPRIVFDLMEGAGLARPAVHERLDDCFEAYARGLAAEVGDGSGVVTHPGIADLVRRLDSAPEALVGLLTGNIEAGARIKLEPTGLRPYFRLGAYGSDNIDRRQLPSLATRRAQALTGESFQPEAVVVIGDTPHDIECARHFGAIAVAVATGLYTRESLEAEQPDLLFDDFSDVEAAFAKLLPR